MKMAKRKHRKCLHCDKGTYKTGSICPHCKIAPLDPKKYEKWKKRREKPILGFFAKIADKTKSKIKEMEEKQMFKKIMVILGIVLALALITIMWGFLPQVMGGFGTVIIIGLCIGLAALIALAINLFKKNEVAKKTSTVGLFISGALIVFALIVGLVGSVISPPAVASTDLDEAVKTEEEAVVEEAEEEIVEEAVIEKEMEEVVVEEAADEVAEVSEGLDYPMETWKLVPAGTLISGDVAIWDGDNNNLKIPVYDNLEETADIIFTTEATYLWFEWGAYVVEEATEGDIETLINQKIELGYTVRYFPSFSKLDYTQIVIYE